MRSNYLISTHIIRKKVTAVLKPTTLRIYFSAYSSARASAKEDSETIDHVPIKDPKRQYQPYS